jgi:hypothetical protein
MPDTGSRNFRCETERWDQAQTKAKQMRTDGYDIDVTKVLNAALDAFLRETKRETATRLGLTKGSEPAKLYRRPSPRMAVEQ